MKYTLLQNLGTIDALHMNKHCGASLSMDVSKLVAGSVIELPDPAYTYLTETRKLVAFLEPANSSKIVGEDKKPALTAPAK